MTYNIPEFRKNLKEAFKAAKSGQTVLIIRHDETFRLVLDGGNSSKASASVKPETTLEIPLMWGRGGSHRFGETFRRFTQCLQWAKEGKTFIYMHPDMVVIDMKTWKKIQKKLNPPKEIIKFYYDEYDTITPENEKLLDDYFKKRVTTQSVTDTTAEHQENATTTDKPVINKGASK